MQKNIVIVGAGYGGLLTAKKLAKRLKRDGVRITLIDKNPYHTMLTELHEVAAGRVGEESIKIELKKIFARRKVDIVLDTAESFDFEKKQVIGKAGTYPYDILVLSAGSKPTFFGVEGAGTHALTLWSYEDAVKLRGHIEDVFRQAAREPDEAKKRALLRFYVVGAGFTGVEMAGELAEYAPVLCRRLGVGRELVSIVNLDKLERIVPSLPDKIARKIERRFEKMGVGLVLGADVTSIGPDHIEIRRNGETLRDGTATVIWTAGIESSGIAAEAAKTLPAEGRGRIRTDPQLRSVGDEHVYVVGDNMFYVPENTGECVPQMVENCEQSAGVAAHNIACALTGRGGPKAYKPSFHGVMVSVGGRYAAAYVGFPGKMFSLASFFAMLSKHFINVIYFLQIAGWNKVFSYLKHEFFTIRDCRSFLGGHFSNRTPSFLLVPLRVFLGAVWVFEGVMKIVEGWLAEPKLEAFFAGARQFYDNITGAAPAAADAAAAATGDAVSSATGQAASAGTTIFNFKILGLFDAIFVSGKELASSALNDFAFKLDIPLLNWFLDRFVLPSPGMQLFMQVFIVTAEILIGLALMGGLFTAPASAASLALQFMFVCTTGLYLGTFWMIFAGVAVLVGAGRTLGLDYYAMPWLKGLWKRIPFIRKWYLYHD